MWHIVTPNDGIRQVKKMAVLGQSETRHDDVKNMEKELITVSRGAVFIKDPRKQRKCPICKHNLYLYNINFEDMFLMCEDSDCEFPFGYEALQIVRDESELQENPWKATKNTFEYPTAEKMVMARSIDSIIAARTVTLSSTSCLSDDILSQVGDAEEHSLTHDRHEILSVRLNRQDRKRKEDLQVNKDVQSHLNQIKQLTEVMSKLSEEADNYNPKLIKNKKWLKNLKGWQEETGQRLLTDMENIDLVKIEPKTLKNELKLSIDQTNEDGPCSFSIQICTNKTEEDEEGVQINDNVKKDFVK